MYKDMKSEVKILAPGMGKPAALSSRLAPKRSQSRASDEMV